MRVGIEVGGHSPISSPSTAGNCTRRCPRGVGAASPTGANMKESTRDGVHFLHGDAGADSPKSSIRHLQPRIGLASLTSLRR